MACSFALPMASATAVARAADVELVRSARILVADDQVEVREALRLLLKTADYETETVGSPAALLEALDRSRFDLVLMDLNYARGTTSGQEGLDLLPVIRAHDAALPVVIMTAWATVELAIESLRHRVGDFVRKPWDNEQLLTTVRAQVLAGRSRRAVEKLHQRELAAAREIQATLLPRQLPALDGYGIAATWQPAAGLGGDHYDVFEVRHGRVALCIADVAGKGLPAALLMSNLQAAIRALAAEGWTPGELCGQLRRMMAGRLTDEKFVTLVYLVLDTAARRLTYANAGHNAPVLVRADGTHTRLQSGGPLIASLSDGRYDEESVRLASGDRLVLFTDGLTELANEAGEEFGEARLVELVREHRRLDAQDIQDRLLEAAHAFAGGAFTDDTTLLVLAVD
jgi:sigma-B regulation protein RsbU (phosphoserine phosphatase)